MQQPAKRIISLSPHLTEIFYAIGVGDRLVGTIRGSDYPAAATSLEIVGDHSSVSIEKVLSLKPDLVALWSSGTHAYVTQQLQRFQIPVFHSDPVNQEELQKDIRALAVLTGEQASGDQVAETIQVKKESLKRKYEKIEKKKRGFFLISDQPLMGLSNAHAIREVFEICSLENYLSDELPVAPIVNREFLLFSKPQFLITTFKVSHPDDWLDQLGFPENNRPDIIWSNPDLLLRQTPRMLTGIEQMCEALWLNLDSSVDRSILMLND